MEMDSPIRGEDFADDCQAIFCGLSAVNDNWLVEFNGHVQEAFEDTLLVLLVPYISSGVV